MKFKAGDKFFVLENGLEGEIIKIIYNSIYQQDEYLVKWNHHAKEESYPVDECDPLWRACSKSADFDLFRGFADFIPITITVGDIKVQCNGHHTWKTYDSGFRRFQYCEHCNEEKHEN